MGFTKHHIISVISSCSEELMKAYKIAENTFPKQMISEILECPTNCNKAFFIAPDGSNERWDTSNRYDKKRNQFVSSISKIECLYWCEVSIDECGTKKVERGDP